MKFASPAGGPGAPPINHKSARTLTGDRTLLADNGPVLDNLPALLEPPRKKQRQGRSPRLPCTSRAPRPLVGQTMGITSPQPGYLGLCEPMAPSGLRPRAPRVPPALCTPTGVPTPNNRKSRLAGYPPSPASPGQRGPRRPAYPKATSPSCSKPHRPFPCFPYSTRYATQSHDTSAPSNRMPPQMRDLFHRRRISVRRKRSPLIKTTAFCVIAPMQ